MDFSRFLKLPRSRGLHLSRLSQKLRLRGKASCMGRPQALIPALISHGSGGLIRRLVLSEVFPAILPLQEKTKWQSISNTRIHSVSHIEIFLPCISMCLCVCVKMSFSWEISKDTFFDLLQKSSKDPSTLC